MEDEEKAAMRNERRGSNESIGFEEVSHEVQRTLRKSLRYASRAYAPFSKFKVGAALLSKSGEVFTGVNVEKTLPLGLLYAPRERPL